MSMEYSAQKDRYLKLKAEVKRRLEFPLFNLQVFITYEPLRYSVGRRLSIVVRRKTGRI